MPPWQPTNQPWFWWLTRCTALLTREIRQLQDIIAVRGARCMANLTSPAQPRVEIAFGAVSRTKVVLFPIRRAGHADIPPSHSVNTGNPNPFHLLTSIRFL